MAEQDWVYNRQGVPSDAKARGIEKSQQAVNRSVAAEKKRGALRENNYTHRNSSGFQNRRKVSGYHFDFASLRAAVLVLKSLGLS